MSEIDDENPESEIEEEEYEEIDLRLQLLIEFASNSKVYFIADGKRYRNIPERLRNMKKEADMEILQLLGLGLETTTSTAYFFNEPSTLEAGGLALKEQEVFQDMSFIPLETSAAFALIAAKKFGCTEMVIDFISEKEVRLSEAEFQHVDRLVTITAIAKREAVFLAQNRGAAVTLEIDDKNYAIAFLDKVNSRETLDGLKAEDSSTTLGSSKPGMLAEDILESDLDGVVFNPATSQQAIMPREEFELLRIASNLVGKQGIAGKFKSVFGF